MTAGAVFTLNTLMVGFGQGIVVGWLKGRIRSRVLVAGHACFAAGHLLFLAADRVAALALAVGVVVLGAGSYTFGVAQQTQVAFAQCGARVGAELGGPGPPALDRSGRLRARRRRRPLPDRPGDRRPAGDRPRVLRR